MAGKVPCPAYTKATMPSTSGRVEGMMAAWQDWADDPMGSGVFAMGPRGGAVPRAGAKANIANCKAVG
jgi:hypothetical protein